MSQDGKDRFDKDFSDKYPEIRKIARRVIKRWRRDTIDSVALTAEVYQRLQSRRNAYPEGECPLGLIWRVCDHIMIDRWRARPKVGRRAGEERSATADFFPLEHPSRVPEPTRLSRNDLIALRDALDCLRREGPDGHLTAEIILDFYGGVYQDEIARNHGISSRTVRAHLATGRAWLKRWFERTPA